MAVFLSCQVQLHLRCYYLLLYYPSCYYHLLMTLFPIAPVVSWDSLTVVAAEKYIECSHFVIVVALRGQHEVIEK